MVGVVHIRGGTGVFAVRSDRPASVPTEGTAVGRRFRSQPASWSVVVVEDVAKFARERFGLASVSGLAAEEAAVVAWE